MPRRSRRSAATPARRREPSGVSATRITRRSPSSRRRSMSPRCSIRSTMPVALACDTSSESARAPIGHRALRLEDGQDLEMDEAQRPRRPAPHVPDHVGRAVGGELVEQVADELLAVGVEFLVHGCAGAAPRVESTCPSWHVDDQCDLKHSRVAAASSRAGCAGQVRTRHAAARAPSPKAHRGESGRHATERCSGRARRPVCGALYDAGRSAAPTRRGRSPRDSARRVAWRRRVRTGPRRSGGSAARPASVPATP